MRHGPNQPNAGELERRDPVDAKHIHGRGVITEHQWATQARPPPQSLWPEGNLPIGEIQTYIGVQ